MTDPTAPSSPPAAAAAATPAAAPPAATDLLNGGQATMEAAREAIKAHAADKEFYKRLTAQDPEVKSAALAEWTKLHQTAYPPPPEITLDSIKDLPANHELRRQAERMNSGIAALLQQADLTPAMQEEIARQQPIAAAEQQAARDEIARLKRDKAWVRNYLDGDRAANTQFTRLHQVISLPTSRTPTTYPVK
jgi:hypothetical protein